MELVKKLVLVTVGTIDITLDESDGEGLLDRWIVSIHGESTVRATFTFFDREAAENLFWTMARHLDLGA